MGEIGDPYGIPVFILKISEVASGSLIVVYRSIRKLAI
jgi:hypothetical protein